MIWLALKWDEMIEYCYHIGSVDENLPYKVYDMCTHAVPVQYSTIPYHETWAVVGSHQCFFDPLD